MAGGIERIATIVSVDIEYEPNKPYLKFTPDIFLTAKVKHDWDENITILGSFKREFDVNDRKSWGSAFKIAEFFESALNKKDLKLNADFSVPEEFQRDVIGRQVMMCSYPVTKMKENGSPYWNTFDRVAQAGAPSGTLKTMVMNAVNGGYIKNYNSNSEKKDNSGDFNYGNNVKTTSPELQLDNIEL
jgi:hypothetical protein